jgi:signal recognition particle receptor subunit beta
MTISASNRRQHERVSINADYRLFIDGREYKGTVKNISFKGALLTMSEPELSSACVSRFADLDVMVGDDEWLSFNCKIVYVTTLGRGHGEFGIGVYFCDGEAGAAETAESGIAAAEQPEQQDSTGRKELKIVIVGNVGSGKSTAVRTVSEVPVIGTEAKATEMVALRHKETTTVSMEYGIAHINSTKLHIYGTPGQQRFDFMVEILCTGAKGMVMLIDHGCNNPLDNLIYYLKHHQDFLSKNPGIIGITHFDNNNNISVTDYQAHIRQHGYSCPAMAVDAREKQDMENLLSNLLLQINSTSRQ